MKQFAMHWRTKTEKNLEKKRKALLEGNKDGEGEKKESKDKENKKESKDKKKRGSISRRGSSAGSSKGSPSKSRLLAPKCGELRN
jgi:hypothetical protein